MGDQEPFLFYGLLAAWASGPSTALSCPKPNTRFGSQRSQRSRHMPETDLCQWPVTRVAQASFHRVGPAFTKSIGTGMSRARSQRPHESRGASFRQDHCRGQSTKRATRVNGGSSGGNRCWVRCFSKTLPPMFLTMFHKKQNIVLTMPLTMLIAHTFPLPGILSNTRPDSTQY